MATLGGTRPIHWFDERSDFYGYPPNPDGLYRGGRKPRRRRAKKRARIKRALRTLARGMMAGCTAPAKPWFRLDLKV